jgi:hypothetical protein
MHKEGVSRTGGRLDVDILPFRLDGTSEPRQRSRQSGAQGHHTERASRQRRCAAGELFEIVGFAHGLILLAA